MPPQLPLSNGLTLQRRREETPTTHQHPNLVAKLPGMNCRLPHHVEGVPSVGMNLSDRDCRPLHATGTEPRIPSALACGSRSTPSPPLSRRTRCRTSRYMQPFLLQAQEVPLRARIAGPSRVTTDPQSRAFASKTIHAHSPSPIHAPRPADPRSAAGRTRR